MPVGAFQAFDSFDREAMLRSFETFVSLVRSVGSMNDWIEEPCSKLQGISDREDVIIFLIRSHSPQQATGNALAVAVHR